MTKPPTRCACVIGTQHQSEPGKDNITNLGLLELQRGDLELSKYGLELAHRVRFLLLQDLVEHHVHIVGGSWEQDRREANHRVKESAP